MTCGKDPTWYKTCSRRQEEEEEEEGEEEEEEKEEGEEEEDDAQHTHMYVVDNVEIMLHVNI